SCQNLVVHSEQRSHPAADCNTPLRNEKIKHLGSPLCVSALLLCAALRYRCSPLGRHKRSRPGGGTDTSFDEPVAISLAHAVQQHFAVTLSDMGAADELVIGHQKRVQFGQAVEGNAREKMMLNMIIHVLRCDE